MLNASAISVDLGLGDAFADAALALTDRVSPRAFGRRLDRAEQYEAGMQALAKLMRRGSHQYVVDTEIERLDAHARMRACGVAEERIAAALDEFDRAARDIHDVRISGSIRNFNRFVGPPKRA